MLSIVRVLAADDPARAASLASDMEHSLDDNELDKFWTCSVVSAWAVLGRTAHAERIVGRMDEPTARIWAYGTLVTEAGDGLATADRARIVGAALAAADEIADAKRRTHTLGELTRQLGQAGYSTLAATCAAHADRILAALPAGTDADKSRHDLVVRFTDAGHVPLAVDLLAGFADIEMAGEALQVISKHVGDPSCASRLREVARTIAARLDERTPTRAPQEPGAKLDSARRRTHLVEALAMLGEVETAIEVLPA